MVKLSVTESRVSWLVGPLKLRVAIQLTLSLRLLKMHCDKRLASTQMSAGVSVAGIVMHFAEAVKLLA